MKIFSIALLTAITLQAAQHEFVCELREGSPKATGFFQRKTESFSDEQKDSIYLKFDSKVSSDIKIEGSFSPILKSVDSIILDTRTNYRAVATDWGNKQAKGSHASIVFNAPDQESFLLQCMVY